MVPPASRRIPRVLRYSGSRLYFVLSSTGLLPSLEPLSFGLRLELFRLHDPTTPIDRSQSVWPLTISLAATKVIEFSFFSSGYLDVSLPRVPSYETMNSSHGDRALPRPGSPIRISMDHGLLAAPHGFSQLIASFFGNQCPGIHPALFLA